MGFLDKTCHLPLGVWPVPWMVRPGCWGRVTQGWGPLFHHWPHHRWPHFWGYFKYWLKHTKIKRSTMSISPPPRPPPSSGRAVWEAVWAAFCSWNRSCSFSTLHFRATLAAWTFEPFCFLCICGHGLDRNACDKAITDCIWIKRERNDTQVKHEMTSKNLRIRNNEFWSEKRKTLLWPLPHTHFEGIS